MTRGLLFAAALAATTAPLDAAEKTINKHPNPAIEAVIAAAPPIQFKCEPKNIVEGSCVRVLQLDDGTLLALSVKMNEQRRPVVGVRLRYDPHPPPPATTGSR